MAKVYTKYHLIAKEPARFIEKQHDMMNDSPDFVIDMIEKNVILLIKV